MKLDLAHELLRQCTVFAVPLAVAAVFPRAAIGFKAADASEAGAAFVSFVNLSDEAEREAVKSAKSPLRGETSRVRRLRADLSFGELPEEPVRPVLSEPALPPAPTPAPLVFGTPRFRPSPAALPPEQLPAADVSAPAPAFPRETLLKLD